MTDTLLSSIFPFEEACTLGAPQSSVKAIVCRPQHRHLLSGLLLRAAGETAVDGGKRTLLVSDRAMKIEEKSAVKGQGGLATKDVRRLTELASLRMSSKSNFSKESFLFCRADLTNLNELAREERGKLSSHSPFSAKLCCKDSLTSELRKEMSFSTSWPDIAPDSPPLTPSCWTCPCRKKGWNGKSSPWPSIV